MVSGWELGRHTTSIAHRKTLCSIYGEPPEVLFAHQDEALSAHAAPLLLASFPEREAMLATVEGARECLVVMGSRSRDPGYLEAIERALEERPFLTCYRVLFGPPHHQVLKDHRPSGRSPYQRGRHRGSVASSRRQRPQGLPPDPQPLPRRHPPAQSLQPDRRSFAYHHR